MINLAISPCPNDTYLFAAWILGLVGKELPCNPSFFDIQELNNHALRKTYPLIKCSFATFREIQNEYELLPIGSALGMGVGPKVISKRRVKLDELDTLRVVLPGNKTTAHFLFSHFFPKAKNKSFRPYHEIESALDFEADVGVIIHESRFTFLEKGFYEICDLGYLWEEKYRLPLPLGGLFLRKDSLQLKKLLTKILTDSLDFARNKGDQVFSFIEFHAQEKSRKVIEEHIRLYVNEETAALSQSGREAINKFLTL